jgi:hypothetical protein
MEGSLVTHCGAYSLRELPFIFKKVVTISDSASFAAVCQIRRDSTAWTD